MRFDPVRTLRHLMAILLAGAALAAHAADMTIFAAGAVKEAFGEVVTKFEKATGHHVAVDYAPVGTLMRRLAEGKLPDLVVLTNDVMPQAEANGWVPRGTAMALGSVGIGVAVRAGAPEPDISTPEAFKQALLAAKSITYIDPEKGTSGKHLAEVLRRLGIADAVKAKTTLGNAGYVVEPVARGDIELGMQQITEILPVPGVKLVGPLPAALQKATVYSAAQTSATREAEAVAALLAYLRRADSRDTFGHKGFQVP
jgi:molybdate transport system substrate-binding protein